MAGEVKKKENNQYIRRERTVCTAGSGAHNLPAMVSEKDSEIVN